MLTISVNSATCVSPSARPSDLYMSHLPTDNECIPLKKLEENHQPQTAHAARWRCSWVTSVCWNSTRRAASKQRGRYSVSTPICAHCVWADCHNPTGRGILFQIPLNLSNHFASSVKTDAKERFRIILTPKTPQLSTLQMILSFVDMTPPVLYSRE